MIGNRLKDRRKAKKFTVQRLADEMGVTRVSVTRWESGVFEPKDESKRRLADLLDTSVAYLTGETDDPSSPKTKFGDENVGKFITYLLGKTDNSNQLSKTYPKPATLEDFARTREASRNLELLEDRDLIAAEEMAKAMLETIQRERAIRTAQQDGVAKSACA